MNKITYHKEGDYLIPDLIMENSYENYHIGKYGRLRLNYIKEYKRGLYTELIMTGKLKSHLIDVDATANARIDDMIKELANNENINESLKLTNQLEWVRCMNSIKNRAEEIIFSELIYV